MRCGLRSRPHVGEVGFGSKCEKLNVSKSGPLCPTKPTSMTGVATSLNGMDRPRSGPTTSEYACGVTKTRRHAMPRKVGTAIVTIGIDPGKNTMHLVGLDARGEIVLREKVARAKVVSRLANVPPHSCR